MTVTEAHCDNPDCGQEFLFADLHVPFSATETKSFDRVRFRLPYDMPLNCIRVPSDCFTCKVGNVLFATTIHTGQSGS